MSGVRLWFCAALLLANLVLTPTEAFIPNSFLAIVAGGGLNNQQTSITHKVMTRSAILRVAADLMREYPFDGQSTQRINDLGSQLEIDSLITAYRGERSQAAARAFLAAIIAIERANSEVDIGSEEKIAAAHFDSEQFQIGQNRLIELRAFVGDNIVSQNYVRARSETGRLLHTLQDFYSHSNWIEMGNTEPYSVLGQPEQRPSNIASPQTQTCTDCTENGRVMLQMIFGAVVGQSADFNYRCDNNIGTEILSNRLLTSGYYSNQVDTNNRVINKPSGKCSRGGFLDPSADDPARGGINKDSLYPDWSPHHLQHFDAARVAEQATVTMLNEIRSDVDNDELFAAFLGIYINIPMPQLQVVAASIAYVVDTTASMGEELPEIQATIPTIRESIQQYRESLGDNAEVNYILVPYNDPDPGTIIETNNINEFLNRFENLTADGGGDTPEPTIGALIRAIKASEEGSPIIVFTDADASDPELLPDAQALIVQKSVTVTFALVDDESDRKRFANDGMQDIQNTHENKRQLDDTYNILATFSGGQVLNLETNDISELGDFIGFSVDQSQITILRQSGDILSTTFHVDSFIQQVVISIDGSGGLQNVLVMTPTGVLASTLNSTQYSVSLQTPTSFIAILTINDSSLRGHWQISLESDNFYNILVSASSDLSFTSDLLTFDTSSSYGFSSVVGKPLNGVPLIIVFQASDMLAALTVEDINIVDSSGTIYETIVDILPLDSNAFAINFIPPDVPFQWQIVGRDEEGYTFSRISDTAIQVSDIDLSLGGGDTDFVVLQPGDDATITITIFNSGGEANFTLNVDSDNAFDFVEHFLDSPTVTVGSNSTVDFLVRLSVFENATDGLASTFTVIARSTLDETNDFVTFQLTVSTRPPPEFIENDFGEAPTPFTSSPTGGTAATPSAVLWLIILLLCGSGF